MSPSVDLPPACTTTPQSVSTAKAQAVATLLPSNIPEYALTHSLSLPLQFTELTRTCSHSIEMHQNIVPSVSLPLSSLLLPADLIFLSNRVPNPSLPVPPPDVQDVQTKKRVLLRRKVQIQISTQ